MSIASRRLGAILADRRRCRRPVRRCSTRRRRPRPGSGRFRAELRSARPMS